MCELKSKIFDILKLEDELKSLLSNITTDLLNLNLIESRKKPGTVQEIEVYSVTENDFTICYSEGDFPQDSSVKTITWESVKEAKLKFDR